MNISEIPFGKTKIYSIVCVQFDFLLSNNRAFCDQFFGSIRFIECNSLPISFDCGIYTIHYSIHLQSSGSYKGKCLRKCLQEIKVKMQRKKQLLPEPSKGVPTALI